MPGTRFSSRVGAAADGVEAGDPIENPEAPTAMWVADLRAELHAAGVDHSARPQSR